MDERKETLRSVVCRWVTVDVEQKNCSVYHKVVLIQGIVVSGTVLYTIINPLSGTRGNVKIQQIALNIKRIMGQNNS